MSPALLATFLLVGYAPLIDRKPSATESNKIMITWWCADASRTDSPGCKHYRLAHAFDKATTEEEKAPLLAQLKAANSGSTMQAVQKEYVQMKMAYCNQIKPPNKTLCAAPATTFKRSSDTENSAVTWYCAQPASKEAEVCKRFEIRKQMQSGGAEQRTELAKELQKLSKNSFSQMQAVYTDYCSVAAHKAVPFCVNTRQAKVMKEVQSAWCAKNADGAWCEHEKFVEVLQQEGVAESERIDASNKLKAINAGKMSKEIVLARRAWCDEKPERATELFCQERPADGK